jgi:hypothetical protein
VISAAHRLSLPHLPGPHALVGSAEQRPQSAARFGKVATVLISGSSRAGSP